MMKISHHAVGVAQGSRQLFSAFEDEGEMWTGSGPREHREEIRFDDAFLAPPMVHVGFSMWDLDNAHNQRADITTTEITREGFTAVFRTWGNTKVARVRVDWMAIGPVRHDDDWDL